jgi:hypothetical protein
MDRGVTTFAAKRKRNPVVKKHPNGETGVGLDDKKNIPR